MRSTATMIPIQHEQRVQEIETTRSRTPDAGEVPQARRPRPRLVGRGRPPCQQYTLLELIEAIGEVTDDEREIIATVLHLIASRQVRLCGNLRDEPVEHLISQFRAAQRL